jgi:hypothetical protein
MSLMSAITGLSSGAGSLLGGIGGAMLSGAFGMRQARKQTEFQKQQSDTAHQRQVADMRKAGLNPILSATGGSGASTPPGAMTTADVASSAKMGAMAIQELRAATAQAGITENEKIRSDILTAPYKVVEDKTSQIVNSAKAAINKEYVVQKDRGKITEIQKKLDKNLIDYGNGRFGYKPGYGKSFN